MSLPDRLKAIATLSMRQSGGENKSKRTVTSANLRLRLRAERSSCARSIVSGQTCHATTFRVKSIRTAANDTVALGIEFAGTAERDRSSRALTRDRITIAKH